MTEHRPHAQIALVVEVRWSDHPVEQGSPGLLHGVWMACRILNQLADDLVHLCRVLPAADLFRDLRVTFKIVRVWQYWFTVLSTVPEVSFPVHGVQVVPDTSSTSTRIYECTSHTGRQKVPSLDHGIVVIDGVTEVNREKIVVQLLLQSHARRGLINQQARDPGLLLLELTTLIQANRDHLHDLFRLEVRLEQLRKLKAPQFSQQLCLPCHAFGDRNFHLTPTNEQ